MGKEISGVILAGGASKRFGGKNKSKISIGGRTIMSRMIVVMEEIFDEIIIVTNSPEEYVDFNKHKIVRDQILKAGPLGGIHAAMETSSKDAVFVFAGDMPFISKKIITDQINKYTEGEFEALVPRINTFIEPLQAIYNNSACEFLNALLRSNDNHAVRDFLSNLDTHYMQLEDSEETRLAFTNINTPHDLFKIGKRQGY